MTAQIQRAEQREFVVLRRGLRAPVRQPSNQPSTAYALLKSAAASAGVASAVLQAVLNGEAALPATLERLGLPKPASRPASSTLGYVHWRRRDRLARTWLDAVQRQRQIADPVQAAAWLAGELAAARPAAPAAAPGVLPHWPLERTALLCRMWAKDVPVPEIVAALGLSRGAVQGKATRLGLPGRHGRLRINHA
jgi:hypothetical protein